jgi:hypothetical protein
MLPPHHLPHLLNGLIRIHNKRTDNFSKLQNPC